MSIEAVIRASRKGPTKKEIIEGIYDDMRHIGIGKFIWVKQLKLPEEDFDKELAKAAKKAEHIAKDDDEGIDFALSGETAKIVINRILKDIKDDDDEDDED